MSCRFSTLFTAHNVRDYLSTEEGIREAIDWCRKTSVDRVYIESFRSDYTVPRDILVRARDRFTEEGFDVRGCVTTCGFGKRSTGWNIICCFTDKATVEQLGQVFAYTASIFDVIMIDDFLFTDCECPDCKAAKGDKSWSEFRCDLMVQLSRDTILKPAREVNPNVKIIIKYPQWYDMFHLRGYEVGRQTEDFDLIWVGTETRDSDDPEWGGHEQYKAYYIMRWLGEIGGAKTGGGWFDPYGTSPPTYLEQAYQTILADADEAVLFCYGSLIRDNGPANIKALRQEMAGLKRLAELVDGKAICGIAAPKPIGSDPHNEVYIYDMIGMLGFPLVPTARLSKDAPGAFLSVHALKDPNIKEYIKFMIEHCRPLLITDGLAEKLKDWDEAELLQNPLVTLLKVSGKPRELYKLPKETLQEARDKMLAPLGVQLEAPTKVSLYLYEKNMEVIENFNNEPVVVTLDLRGREAPNERQIIHSLPKGNGSEIIRREKGKYTIKIGPRSLVVLR